MLFEVLHQLVYYFRGWVEGLGGGQRWTLMKQLAFFHSEQKCNLIGEAGSCKQDLMAGVAVISLQSVRHRWILHLGLALHASYHSSKWLILRITISFSVLPPVAARVMDSSSDWITAQWLSCFFNPNKSCHYKLLKLDFSSLFVSPPQSKLWVPHPLKPAETPLFLFGA